MLFIKSSIRYLEKEFFDKINIYICFIKFERNDSNDNALRIRDVDDIFIFPYFAIMEKFSRETDLVIRKETCDRITVREMFANVECVRRGGDGRGEGRGVGWGEGVGS